MLPRRSLCTDLTLALLPTATVLAVFALVEAWAHQKLLFASLASSAFLIYLDPEHETNSTRTLVVTQGMAVLAGFAAQAVLGPSFWAAGAAMIVIILSMVLFGLMHPPAVSTALSFALGAGTGRSVVLFGVCVALMVLLVFGQRAVARLLARASGGSA